MKNRRTLIVCRRLHRLIEIDHPRKAYCSQCTSDTASYGTDTMSFGSSGKKGLPGLCIVLPLPPTLVYFAVLQPGLFSVYCLIHCTTTRTTFSELHQALAWSAIVFSKSELSSVCCQIYFDVIHYWPWIFCSLGQLQWPNLLYSSGCCH